MKHRKISMLFARLIAVMPLNPIRIFLYKILLGYTIKQTRIARGTIIAVKQAELIGCTIAENNRFIGPMNVTIQAGANIGPGNLFDCEWWTQDEQFKNAGYECQLTIGENTLITANHHFDIAGAFTLGSNSWIGGAASQFWTHGAGVTDRNISIGKRCYIASAVRFAPGVTIPDNCIVGLGSIVTKKFNAPNSVIAGNPAKVLKENYDWKTKTNISE